MIRVKNMQNKYKWMLVLKPKAKFVENDNIGENWIKHNKTFHWKNSLKKQVDTIFA